MHTTTKQEIVPLGRFRKALRDRIDSEILAIREQENVLPVSFELRSVYGLNVNSALVETSLASVLTEYRIRFRVGKLWHSFFWHSRIEITSIDVPNEIVWLDEY